MITSANMVARIDAHGGVAGDMFVGACAHAWPQYCDEVLKDVRKAGFPDDLDCHFETVIVNGLEACYFNVDQSAEKRSLHAGYSQIIDWINNSELIDSTKHHACEIFKIIGKSEAIVHKKPLDDIHFHELADWDSVADVIAAASFIDRVKIKYWQCSPLPLGGGRVETAHGSIPVPAPAVVEILKNFDWIDDGVPGERVTPTGAAIISYLTSINKVPQTHSAGCLVAAGSGAGLRRFDQLANITRILAFQQHELMQGDRVVELAFEIDDMTSEEISIGLDQIRKEAGVLDAAYGIRYGKKSRLQFAVRLLVCEETIDEVIRACFDETSTLGVRKTRVSRSILQRTSVEVLLNDGMVRVKSAIRPGGDRTHKAESDAVANLPKLGVRRARRDKAERLAEILPKGPG